MIGANAIATLPLAAISTAAPAAAIPALPLGNRLPATRRLTLIEIEAASTAPVSSTSSPSLPLAATPLGVSMIGGAQPLTPATRPTTTVRASDIGYRSRRTDAGGVQAYRAIMRDGLAVDRAITLVPSATAAGAAWGVIQLMNVDRALTATAETFSPAGRRLTVRWGHKAWDAARGIETDPPLAALGVLFEGVGKAWDLGDRTLDVQVRDASWYAEKPLQGTLYGGTGGYEGPSELAGQPKPKLRGGTPSAPVRDVEPVLVDPVALIYQISDARAVITTLYERGDGTTIPFQANVSDLYSGSTAPGQYRTDQARGLFQLGSPPAGRITCDAYGATLSGDFEANAALLALSLLYEDLGVAAASVEQASFLALARAWPFPAGWYWREPVETGLDAVALMLASCNATLVPRRDGRLMAVARARAAKPAAPFVVHVIREGQLAAGVSFRRDQPNDSVATYQDALGVWQTAQANELRWTGSRRRLLREAAAINRIRNPRCVDAVPNGALPTHWVVGTNAGLTTTVVSTQTVNGVETVTLRVNGTSNASAYILHLEGNTIIPAAPNGRFALSCFVRLDASPAPPANYRLRVHGRESNGAAIAGELWQKIIEVSDTLRRSVFEGTFGNSATLAFARPSFIIVPENVGDPIDVTVTLGWPNYTDRLSTPVLPAPGTIATSSRGADVIGYTLPSSASGYTVQAAVVPAATPATGDAFTIVQLDDGSDFNRLTIGAGETGGTLRVARATANAVDSVSLPGTAAAETRLSVAASLAPSGAIRATVRGQRTASLTGGPPRVTTLRIGAGATAEWQGEIEAVTLREGAETLSTPALATSIGPSFAAEPIRMVALYGQSRADNRAEGQFKFYAPTRTAQQPDLALRMRGPSSPGLPFERRYEARWTDRFEPMRDGTGLDRWPTLVNGVEDDVAYLQLGQSAGSLLWRMVDKDAAAQRPPRRWLFLAGGIGGASIAVLSKGGSDTFAHGTFSPYQRFMDAVTQANRVARSVYGVPLIVDAVVWAQGERDGELHTPPATYQAALAQLVVDLTGDLQATTGQDAPPYFVTDLIPPRGTGNGQYTAISQAQEAATLADTTGLLHAFGPLYHLPFRSSQHHSVEGVVLWGEMIAEAVYPLITAGVSPTWLRRGTISVSGSTITVPTIGAQGPLVLDTMTVPLAPNHGFHLSGTAATITGVSVSGTTITITCSASPTGGTLHYAGILAGGNNNGATGYAGAYGNVRDSYGVPSALVPNNTLRRFLAAFQVVL